MCQNTQNMKITPVTDICSKGNFVKKRHYCPVKAGKSVFEIVET